MGSRVEEQKKPKKQNPNEWRFKKGLDAFGNMFGLNVCFVVACLPVFTIGASLSATYAMAIRLQEDEEETILHGFIHEFKRSFKKATIAWILVLLAAAILLAENILVNNPNLGIGPGVKVFYTIIFYLELLLVALVLAFLFPLIGRYETTVKMAIKNSLLLSVGYVFSAIKIIVAWVAPILLSIIYPMIFLYTWYLWLLLLFGAIIWGTTHTIRYVFNRNEDAMENTKKEKEEKEKEKDELEKKREENREKKQLPPKKELKGIAAKANVLAGNAQTAPGNASAKGRNQGGWYRGDKYDKKKKGSKKK
ncbi:MAG: YesL family protein [Eubacterium sp.]|nr:YesL family protein [Eubacterium sp.]